MLQLKDFSRLVRPDDLLKSFHFDSARLVSKLTDTSFVRETCLGNLSDDCRSPGLGSEYLQLGQLHLVQQENYGNVNGSKKFGMKLEDWEQQQPCFGKRDDELSLPSRCLCQIAPYCKGTLS